MGSRYSGGEKADGSFQDRPEPLEIRRDSSGSPLVDISFKRSSVSLKHCCFDITTSNADDSCESHACAKRRGFRTRLGQDRNALRPPRESARHAIQVAGIVGIGDEVDNLS